MLDNTWQAYNRWPGNYSVYTHPQGNQGPWADVSFDRPYGPTVCEIFDDPLSLARASSSASSSRWPTGSSSTATT